jgi:hypothetical protein
VDNTEKLQITQEGFETLCLWARNIALLPLEEWDEALEKAESIGYIINPTLYREFIYSKKALFIRRLIKAAIPLKKLILEAQPLAKAELFPMTTTTEERT